MQPTDEAHLMDTPSPYNIQSPVDVGNSSKGSLLSKAYFKIRFPWIPGVHCILLLQRIV
ncbi:hypothetical protein AVEN_216229-1, partial [Araneus ventricosus]